TTLDRAGVKARFDVDPEQIVDYLALVGDASDNIPGVPKVGPKTAAKWLASYRTVDELVAHAAQIEGKVGESLRENLAQLELSRKLATIRCDLALPLEPVALAPRPPDVARLKALYRRFEFHSLLRALEPGPAADTVPAAVAEQSRPAGDGEPDALRDAIVAAPRHYETVLTEQQFGGWLERLRTAELFAFDTETTGLDYMTAEIVGLSFATAPGAAAYVPLMHDYAGA